MKRSTPFLALVALIAFLAAGCESTTSPSGGGSTGGLTASLSSVTIGVGASTTVKISGGKKPYSLDSKGDSTIARVTLVDSTVTVLGLKAGSTSASVKDSSNSKVTILITVSSGGGGQFTSPGTFGFNSDKGNYSVTGILDTSARSGQGAGAVMFTQGNAHTLFVVAYKFNSATSADVALLEFVDSTSAIAQGSYSFTFSANKYALFLYLPNANPNIPEEGDGYMLTSGTASISTLSSNNTKGSFSGNGFLFSNQSQTIAVTGGTFDVPLISLTNPPKNSEGALIEPLAHRLINKILQK